MTWWLATRPVSVRRSMWLWAQLATPDATVRAIYHRAEDPADRHIIYLYDTDGLDSGLLNWAECPQCHRGVIAKISIGQNWQRRGVGRLLLAWALRDKETWTWSTTSRSPDGKQFFAAMTRETGTPFAELTTPCLHITRRRRYAEPPVRRWPRGKVLFSLSMACTSAVNGPPSPEA